MTSKDLPNRGSHGSSGDDNDFMHGAKAIGDWYGVSTRRAFYMCEKGLIPAFKFGNIWCARKSKQRKHVEELEAVTG